MSNQECCRQSVAAQRYEIAAARRHAHKRNATQYIQRPPRHSQTSTTSRVVCSLAECGRYTARKFTADDEGSHHVQRGNARVVHARCAQFAHITRRFVVLDRLGGYAALWGRASRRAPVRRLQRFARQRRSPSGVHDSRSLRRRAFGGNCLSPTRRTNPAGDERHASV